MASNNKATKGKSNEVSELDVLQTKLNESLAHQEQMHHELKESNDEIFSLRNRLKAIREAEEREYDQSTMTVKRAAILLRNAYNKILCPVTKKEALKQFVADIALTNDKSIKENSQRVVFDTNINSDITSFLGRIESGSVVKEVSEVTNTTDGYAVTSQLHR